MSSTIVKPSTLDKSLIHFSEPNANNYGGKTVKPGYSEEKKFLIQTPDMLVGFDLSKEEVVNKDPVIGKDGKPLPPGVKYSVQLSFKGMEGNDTNGKRLKLFHKMINELDEALIDEASRNSLTWLKMKNAPREVIDALINRTIKVSKDPKTQEPNGKYPDLMKLKIPFYAKDNKLGCDVFDKDGELIQNMDEALDKFRRGVVLSSIIECSLVYFSNGKYGYTYSLYQCCVKSEPLGKMPRGKCLITDSDDEDDSDDEGAPSTQPTSVATTNQPQVSFAKTPVVQNQSSDDELDGNDSEPDTPPPAPKPEVVVATPATTTKKVIRKVAKPKE